MDVLPFVPVTLLMRICGAVESGSRRLNHLLKPTNNSFEAPLFSNFKNGASNELFVGFNKWFNRRDPLSTAPQIRINNVTGTNGNTSILAGADQFSQGNQLDTK